MLGSADGSSLELIPYSHNAEVLKIDNPVERHKDHVDFQNQQPGLILQCHQTAWLLLIWELQGLDMAWISLMQVSVFLDTFCDKISSCNFRGSLWNVNFLPEPGARAEESCVVLEACWPFNTFLRMFLQSGHLSDVSLLWLCVMERRREQTSANPQGGWKIILDACAVPSRAQMTVVLVCPAYLPHPASKAGHKMWKGIEICIITALVLDGHQPAHQSS